MRRFYEWKSRNTNNSTQTSPSKNYKNRFKKLTDYAIAHKAPTATQAEVKQLNNNGFIYTEHHNDNGKEYDIALFVATSKFTYDWAFQFHIDGEYDSGKQGEGYEDLVRALAFYMNTPNIGTPEYDNLLIESKSTIDDFDDYKTLWKATTNVDLAEWHTRPPVMNQTNNAKTVNKPLSKYGLPSYKKEFLKLSKHMNSVHTLYLDDAIYDDWGVSDHLLRLYYSDTNGADFRLEVTTTEWSSAANGRVESWDWVLEELDPNAQIIDRGPLKDYNHLLDELLKHGVIKNKSKCK